MISTLRRSLNTWVVRGFFLILVAAFGLWGIGDVVRNVGTTTWVAKVGDRTIEPQEAQDAFRAALAQYTRGQPGSDPSPAVRRQIAAQAVQSLILRAALDAEAQRLHVAVPDAALRQSVFAIPAFQGLNGTFDRQRFETILRNNNLTEPTFLAMQRVDLARRQILEAVSTGIAVPDLLTPAAAHTRAHRPAADMVEFPFAAVAPPAPPDAAVLTRWYDNHPWLYSTPAYRRIKAVILATQTLAKEIPVTDAELHAAYEQNRDAYVTPARRSVQVVLEPDAAKAAALADKWRAGADWPAMQAAAKADGGTAVELDKASETEFPVAELGRAVFAAPLETIPAPVHTTLGWYVLRVTAETPASEKTFDQVKDALHDQIAAGRATDALYDRANKLDNILATGATLDQIPADLGAVAVAGTLDAEGNTPDGKPAPIPGPPELRAAIIAAAFQLPKDDPPHLVEVPAPKDGGSAYYALSVEAIEPPTVRPFADVRDKVLADWTTDQVHRAQNVAASAMLNAVNKGESLADAALKAGATVRRSPAVDRSQPEDGMPAQLQRVLFGMKKGEAAEVETADGFVVAVLTDIQQPDPKQLAPLYAEIKGELNRETANDAVDIFADALRDRASAQVNQSALDQVSQP
jgi:peptidyl-prolyl cis-trans isomerase D